MKRKNLHVDRILHTFQSILKHKPSPKIMIKDIHMMKFKIKPVSGDVSQLNMGNDNFIEMIWSMGKLEEIMQKAYYNLDTNGKKMLLQVFDNLFEQFQERLNKISVREEAFSEIEEKNKLEIEIFKDTLTRKMN